MSDSKRLLKIGKHLGKVTGNKQYTGTVFRDWLTDWVMVLYCTQHKIGHFGAIPQANLLAWYGKTKTNNESTHLPIERNVLQHKINTKTKARFSRLLRHLAWKRRGPIFILALHKFATYLLAKTLTHLLTAPGTHMGLCPRHTPSIVKPHKSSRTHSRTVIMQQILHTGDRVSTTHWHHCH